MMKEVMMRFILVLDVEELRAAVPAGHDQS